MGRRQVGGARATGQRSRLAGKTLTRLPAIAHALPLLPVDMDAYLFLIGQGRRCDARDLGTELPCPGVGIELDTHGGGRDVEPIPYPHNACCVTHQINPPGRDNDAGILPIPDEL